ncbi:MAG: DMT family transporter [Bacillota bacterium]
MIQLNRYLPYLAGIGVALTWGMSFTFTRGALDHLLPFHLLGLRFAMAVFAMALLRGLGVIRIKVTPADYISLIPLALFQPILYFSAETTGILLTSASYSGMMIAVIPIFVAIFAAPILKEYPNRAQLSFIITSVSGVIFIIFMDAQALVAVNPIGTLFLLFAVMAGAGYNITSRKASINHPPLRTTWVMMVVGAVVFNVIALGQHLITGSMDAFLFPLQRPEVWTAVIYLGIFSSIGAFFLYNFVLSKITATQGSVFANLVTVIAVAGGVIFRGETVYWYHLVGTAAILAGVWGTNYFAPTSKRNRRNMRSAESSSYSL